MEKPQLILFSGGRSSALAARVMTTNGKKDNQVVLFCNTGKEREETLEFINECDKRWNLEIIWIESVTHPERGVGQTFREVTYETASRNGEPFNALIAKKGLPNRVSRFCSGDLKIKPAKKYMQSLGFDYWEVVMGIRADEMNRVKQDVGEPYTKTYPLVEARITKEIVRNWWDKQPFDLKLKDYEGNCDLCHLKSLRKLKTIAKENPTTADWWIEAEQKAPIKPEYSPQFRSDYSFTEIAAMAKSTFSMVKDEHLSNKQLNAFELEQDFEISCFCGD